MRTVPLFATWLTAFVVGCTGSNPIPADLAITHVAVVDVENGRVLANQTVLIAGNRIVAVGPSESMRTGAAGRVVEAGNKYLIPGLWDMHAHTVDDRITRETFLPLYLANGVTGFRNMHADCFDPCDEDRTTLAQVGNWRREIATGELSGPRIIAASDVVQGPFPGQPSRVERPGTAAQARALVTLLKGRGVDLIKTYNLLSREAYFALADEAGRQGIPFAGHVPLSVRASEASDAGHRSVEHFSGLIEECSAREEELRPRLLEDWGAPGFLDHHLSMLESFDAAKCERLYTRFAQNGTWHVPTLVLVETYHRIGSEAWHEDPRISFVSELEREYWAQRLQGDAMAWTDGLAAERPQQARFREIVAGMHRAGVGIMAGTDAGMPFIFAGFSLHEELKLLVSAGLTEAEALRAATLEPARYLAATDSLGSVDVGKLADLVLLEGNPLAEISNTQRISAIVFDGRYFDRRSLDQLLGDVEAAANRGLTRR
jgi:hypothetical protein